MKKIILSTSFLGLHGFNTYHGYGDPKITLQTDRINEDKEEGYIDYSEEDFWHDFDNNQYMKDLSENVVDKVDEIIGDLFMYYLKVDAPKVNHYGYHSPKEYNFSTDEFYFELESNYIGYILRTCLKPDNKNDFEQFLKDNYTSYDGFRSFIPNNVHDFTKEFLQGKETVIGVALEFLINTYFDKYNIYDEFICDLEMSYHDYYKPNNE